MDALGSRGHRFRAVTELPVPVRVAERCPPSCDIKTSLNRMSFVPPGLRDLHMVPYGWRMSPKCSVALHLLGFLFDLAWTLNPSDPNVCSPMGEVRMTPANASDCYTTSVKESYAHPFDQVYEEPCSDAWSFYKCTRHRITYKTAYRQAVKMDYRRSSLHKGVCSRRCVAPDHCQCEDGWHGEDCSSAALLSLANALSYCEGSLAERHSGGGFVNEISPPTLSSPSTERREEKPENLKV
ncbi:hypothetical protein SKAU_G00408100 [Synaphobranchus kaupii]|uniref:EMI domain-containing protein n=1 Tax=Synaphobranchus kaupii TaxID=118154 RepID=A0A9Q1EAG5_SYNKA|nr:hypothetical protein SKAU_G00408100 [Synaphobranchus kaupii]